jgi:hypothetical protein
MAEPRRARDFEDVLASPERPLIVGGQAVNIWAEHYSVSDSQLAAESPFLSKDADIIGDRTLVEKLAQTPGWTVRLIDEPRQTAVAMLWKEQQEGKLTVEVLRSVKGLAPKDLVDSDVVELQPGKIYRLPSPIRMMKAKLANLGEIRPTREQDLRHVRLLVPICRHYLTDRLQEVRAGRMTEREWINAYHELREIVTQRSAQALDAKYQLSLGSVFPVAASAKGLSKIAQLYAHVNAPHARRLPRQSL